MRRECLTVHCVKMSVVDNLPLQVKILWPAHEVLGRDADRELYFEPDMGYFSAEKSWLLEDPVHTSIIHWVYRGELHDRIEGRLRRLVKEDFGAAMSTRCRVSVSHKISIMGRFWWDIVDVGRTCSLAKGKGTVCPYTYLTLHHFWGVERRGVKRQRDGGEETGDSGNCVGRPRGRG